MPIQGYHVVRLCASSPVSGDTVESGLFQAPQSPAGGTPGGKQVPPLQKEASLVERNVEGFPAQHTASLLENRLTSLVHDLPPRGKDFPGLRVLCL